VQLVGLVVDLMLLVELELELMLELLLGPVLELEAAWLSWDA